MGQLLRPRASRLQARAYFTLPAAESFPWALMFMPPPLQCIGPAEPIPTVHYKAGSGFPLKKPKIPQTTWFKDLKYDHLATCVFIN